MSKPNLLFLLTEDWFFCSHFIERAVAAKEAGYEVIIAAREGAHGARIRAADLRFVPLALERNSTNPLKEMRLLWEIFRLYRRERPLIVHQVSAKPVLYGSAAALLAGVPAIVNAPVGMGYVFSSEDLKARVLRPLVHAAYRLLTNPSSSRVIFENGNDLDSFVEWGAVRATDAILIRGAGVDVEKFQPTIKRNAVPIIALVARMLRDKGVEEFIAAAHRLYDQEVDARFVLVGSPDRMNPASIPEERLRAWHGKKGVEWWGWRDDIPEVLAQVDVMCLPSYREGLPKSLIEAAACGLPIVTTDTTGCREVVIDGHNGLLVPVRDEQALADALRRLAIDPHLRKVMGNNGAELAKSEFSSKRIINETLSVYSDLLSLLRPRGGRPAAFTSPRPVKEKSVP